MIKGNGRQGSGLHSIAIDGRYCPRFISGPYSGRVRPSALRSRGPAGAKSFVAADGSGHPKCQGTNALPVPLQRPPDRPTHRYRRRDDLTPTLLTQRRRGGDVAGNTDTLRGTDGRTTPWEGGTETGYSFFPSLVGCTTSACARREGAARPLPIQ